MKALNWTKKVWQCVTGLTVLLVLSGCEVPVPNSVQHGYRGTGMLQVYNTRLLANKVDANVAPVALPQAPSEGPKASQTYKNVQVLGNLSAAQFNRLMVSMTAWVSPNDGGCIYCHNPANFADDEKYTKVVARRMLQMTQYINTEWKPHVAETGVTCYTCHRGQPVPSAVWFTKNHQPNGSNFLGDKAGQNEPSAAVDLASLPNDPFTPFLLQAKDIRMNGPTPLQSGNRHSTKQTEWTYGLMTHMSTSLGVNCTYCHNSRSFQSWENSPPQRVTAWHGIRMARDLNVNYLESLTPVFPDHRKGELGDAPKLNCNTCHQGAYKPLFGAPMAKDFPELSAPASGKPAQVAAK